MKTVKRWNRRNSRHSIDAMGEWLLVQFAAGDDQRDALPREKKRQ